MLPKFRVWYNVHEGKMYPIQSIRTNKDGSITVNATDDPDDWNPIQVSGKWQTGYLMQFVGLKDKNGTEIYEGDILRFHQLVLFSRNGGEKYEIVEAEVIWYEGYGLPGFTLKVVGKHHLHTLDATKGEIIGNIYENGCKGIRKKSVEVAP